MSESVVPIKAVIFDLGGVLIDIDFSKTIAAWAHAAGLPYAQVHQRYAVDEPYRRHERGEIDSGQYFDSLRTSLQIDLSDEQFLAGWLDLLIGEIDGVRSIVRSVGQQVPVAIFSNTNAAHISTVSDRHGALLQLFNNVFLSYEMGLRKPETQAFEAVLSELAITPEQALFFDDSTENIAAARAVGMQAVQVAGTSDIRQGLARAGVIAV